MATDTDTTRTAADGNVLINRILEASLPLQL